MSVKVTQSRPSFAIQDNADSKKGIAVPYGSRSTTSKYRLSFLIPCMRSIASLVNTTKRKLRRAFITFYFFRWAFIELKVLFH